MKNIFGLKIAGALGLALALALAAPNAMSADVKIATIDLDAVFKGYYETKRAESMINDRLNEYKKARQDKQDVLRKLQEDIEALEMQINDPTLSAEKRAERVRESENKKIEGRRLLQEFNDYNRNAEQELSLLSERRRKDILDKIRKVIEQKAREQTLHFVFDTSGHTTNNTPVILYSDTRTDITQDVLATLNREAPALTPNVPRIP